MKYELYKFSFITSNCLTPEKTKIYKGNDTISSVELVIVYWKRYFKVYSNEILNMYINLKSVLVDRILKFVHKNNVERTLL